MGNFIPAVINGGIVLNGPADDGIAGQALVTDGAGGLAFASIGSAEEIASLTATLVDHVDDDTNPHGVTAAQVGLGNVTNSAQVPLSTVAAAGDLIVATGAASVGRLGIGTNGQLLGVSGGLVGWVSPSYEPGLGNPSINGQVLTSTTGGARGWTTIVSAVSPLTLTASLATERPLRIVAHGTQSANLIEVDSSSGSGGDLLRVGSDGVIRTRYASNGIQLVLRPNTIDTCGVAFDQANQRTSIVAQSTAALSVWYGNNGLINKWTGRAGFSSPGGNYASEPDAFFTCPAPATIQMGADAATPIAQFFKAHDGVGTDKAGAGLVVGGGQGTGTGSGGGWGVQFADAALSSGATKNAYTIVMGVNSAGITIGESGSRKIGFYGVAPVARQVLATGAGRTVDDVISFLQTIGLCRQS